MPKSPESTPAKHPHPGRNFADHLQASLHCLFRVEGFGVAKSSTLRFCLVFSIKGHLEGF